MSETFYKFPHALFSDKYSGISNDGKLLYCLMLDRAELSQNNGWKDNENRVYIIFTREEAEKTLGVGKDKVSRLFAELERAELITQKKRYLGKPNLIYVNKLPQDEPDGAFSDPLTAQKQRTESAEADLWNTENQTHGKRKNSHSDSVKTAATKTDNNQTEKSYTENSQNYPNQTTCGSDGVNGRIEKHNSNKLLIEEIDQAIEIETLKRNYPASENTIDEIRDIIADVISGRRRVTFEGKTVPEDIAAERFGKLGAENVCIALEALAESESEIRRVDAYIATTLYSSTFTVFSRGEVGWKRLI